MPGAAISIFALAWSSRARQNKGVKFGFCSNVQSPLYTTGVTKICWRRSNPPTPVSDLFYVLFMYTSVHIFLAIIQLHEQLNSTGVRDLPVHRFLGSLNYLPIY